MGMTEQQREAKRRAFELGAVSYIGEACSVCNRTFEDFEELKTAVFMPGAKVAHEDCVKEVGLIKASHGVDAALRALESRQRDGAE